MNPIYNNKVILVKDSDEITKVIEVINERIPLKRGESRIVMHDANTTYIGFVGGKLVAGKGHLTNRVEIITLPMLMTLEYNNVLMYVGMNEEQIKNKTILRTVFLYKPTIKRFIAWTDGYSDCINIELIEDTSSWKFAELKDQKNEEKEQRIADYNALEKTHRQLHKQFSELSLKVLELKAKIKNE